MELTDEIYNIHMSGTFLIQGLSDWSFFSYRLVNLLYSTLMSEMGDIRVF